MYDLRPGDVVSVKVLAFGMYFDHFGVVAWDRFGGPTVISKSRAHGEVVEEWFDNFTGGEPWKIHPDLRGRLRGEVVVRRARARLGELWEVTANCEHFVREIHGLQSSSPQLRGRLAIGGGVAGLVLLPFAPAAAAWAMGLTAVGAGVSSRRR